MEIMKRTDEIKVNTEEEAMALIESFKEKSGTENPHFRRNEKTAGENDG